MSRVKYVIPIAKFLVPIKYESNAKCAVFLLVIFRFNTLQPIAELLALTVLLTNILEL